MTNQIPTTQTDMEAAIKAALFPEFDNDAMDALLINHVLPTYQNFHNWKYAKRLTYALQDVLNRRTRSLQNAVQAEKLNAKITELATVVLSEPVLVNDHEDSN